MRGTDLEALAARQLGAPASAVLTAAVERQGLQARRVRADDPAGLAGWHSAVARGFLDGEPGAESREGFAARAGRRRMTGVHDPAAPQPDVPVATLVSWIAELSVPGGATAAWAISGVTVAPTHRRRGLLRALVESELGDAVALGLPVAALTVTEAGIYGRFGFAPAAFGAEVEIDVRAAGWAGPVPGGRVDFVSREQAREAAVALHRRVRRATPGEMSRDDAEWERSLGLGRGVKDGDAVRVAQYRGEAGAIDGLVVYTVSTEKSFSSATVRVRHLLAATDDAYAALWRFVLSMDLIGTVRADCLSVDEPLWWMLANRHAARVEVADHHWLRVLDVPAALEARTYGVDDEVVLEVDDPLGHAAGRFVLRTDGGAASVARLGAAQAAEPADVRLGVTELSAILLGGVAPSTLARAGRLDAADPDRLTRLFASPTPPRLGFVY